MNPRPKTGTQFFWVSWPFFDGDQGAVYRVHVTNACVPYGPERIEVAGESVPSQWVNVSDLHVDESAAYNQLAGS